ncbi:LuxR C-terminal-related transcriptional regulator [Buttiauxella noackiae]|uniref:LuxR C-terminal-related transcriptional regulator n=1 Tax=Buttiauxella noackiae TaxID=82992 RepID=UPI0028D0AA6C|nr:LuxR C-terminal-related transcriptional regulator [Buttiauxella noackiae]
MDKFNICSQNLFFKCGVESVLNDLPVLGDSLIWDKLIITDSIESLLQLNIKDLKSHSVILFVKDHRYMSLINHYGFHIILTTLMMTETVEGIRRCLADVFCKIRRKINVYNNSLYTPGQVWLTERELNILMLSCSGKAVDIIANKLTLSQKSVLNYRAAALKKLGSNLSASMVNFMLSINKLHGIC